MRRREYATHNDTLDLRSHIEQLADHYNIKVIWLDAADWRKAVSSPTFHFIAVAPITDDGKYFLALHELGHVVLKHLRTPDILNRFVLHVTGGWTKEEYEKQLKEEKEANAWAKAHAHRWTPAMEALECEGEETYSRNIPIAIARDEVIATMREQLQNPPATESPERIAEIRTTLATMVPELALAA